MKINVKNTIKTTAATATAMALAASPAFAAITNPLKWSNICDAIGGVTLFIFGIAGAVALVLLVMGGIQYMTSGGDKVAVESARGRITASVVGLLIVFGSWLVINTLIGAISNQPFCK